MSDTTGSKDDGSVIAQLKAGPERPRPLTAIPAIQYAWWNPNDMNWHVPFDGCRACQARLAAAQADLTDEQTKAATLVKERDGAIRTAKGEAP